MNPRPKIVSSGFYMLILIFKFNRWVSFRRDTLRHSLKSLTGQGPDTLMRRSHIVDVHYRNLREGSRLNGSCL